MKCVSNMHWLSSRLFLFFILCAPAGLCAMSDSMDTSITSTETSMTTQHDSFGYIVLYLSGKTLVEFTALEKSVREAIADISKNYCKTHQILPLDNATQIGADNVKINSLGACPSDWPRTSTCVCINFSVKVNPREMTSLHLESMWHGREQHNLLQMLGIVEYEPGNRGKLLALWLVAISALAVLLVGVLLLITCTPIRDMLLFRRLRREKPERRNSADASVWSPKRHEQQLVPPFLYPQPETVHHRPLHPLEEQACKEGFVNRAFLEEGTDTKSTEPKREISGTVDDFDSDEEIVYPSPLTYRSIKGNPTSNERAQSEEIKQIPNTSKIHTLDARPFSPNRGVVNFAYDGSENIKEDVLEPTISDTIDDFDSEDEHTVFPSRLPKLRLAAAPVVRLSPFKGINPQGDNKMETTF